jgi:predicted Rossmann fold flavoprotein
MTHRHMTHGFDALILGGGAAGLMCAIEAGKRGRRVAVLERADRPGKKILISGGGRCNFTNLYCGPDNFLSSKPHFAKSALARYTPADFIALVEKHGIPYHEKTRGQLFCDRSARDITGMLEAECREAKVTMFPNTKIQGFERSHEFVLQTATCSFRAGALVVATGGLSIPKIGATSFGYDLARQFDIAIRQPRPALVPLVFGEDDRSRYRDLSGVSAEVIAACNGRQFREKMLFTHRGLSGPAILQISSYWGSGESSNESLHTKDKPPVVIDLAPGIELSAAFRDSNTPRNPAALRTELRRLLAQRLADRWLDAHLPASWTNSALADFERQIHAWVISPAGTEGYEKAEVTAGGVDTEELSAKTMESRKIPRLFFIGEVVDVTGQLGGFNFQWAWASGAAAGRAL